MPPNLFTGATIGTVADATAYTANFVLLEASLFDLGPYIISGLGVSAGAGLSVSVSAGAASIGGEVNVAGSFNIGGLAPSTTNHLYLLQNGTGTSNTTGTPPALSVKLGTCTTGAGSVTAVQQGRNSGRQRLIPGYNLIPGGPSAGLASAGHPASIDLANWAASAAEGVAVFDVLPAGALPPSGGPRDVVTKSADYTLVYGTNYYVKFDCSGGSHTATLPTAVGHKGERFEIKKIDATANVLHVTTTGGQTIEGAAPPYDITSPLKAILVVSDGSNWDIW